MFPIIPKVHQKKKIRKTSDSHMIEGLAMRASNSFRSRAGPKVNLSFPGERVQASSPVKRDRNVSNLQPLTEVSEDSGSERARMLQFRTGSDNSSFRRPAFNLERGGRMQGVLGAAVAADQNRLHNLNRPVYTLDEPEMEASSTILNRLCCNIPVIHPLSKFRNYWDFMVILLVVYTSLVLPVRTAFQWADEVMLNEDGTVAGSPDGWTIMDIVIDFTFLFDVILNFNTGYIREPDFVAIMSRTHIAYHYLKGWCIFDILSSLPLDLMIMQQSNTAMKLPRVLRLIRTFRLIKVLRLSRAVRYAQRLQIFAGMSTFATRVTKLIVLGAVFLHWNACLQFLVAAATEFPAGCWVEQMGIIDDDMFTQYTWALFLAASQMFCIGYGPVMPLVVQEAWMIMLSFIMGASLFAVFVGIITSVLISIDAISSQFYQKTEVVNQYMAHRKLPLDLRQRIRDAMDYKWRTRRALDEHVILQDMPSGLRSEVAVFVCKPLIMKVPFFKDVSEGFVESLVTSLQPEVFLAGELIVKEGMLAREMYFLNMGTVQVIANGVEIVTFEEGNYFGEIGVLHRTPRSATCLAVTDCEVFVLSKDALEEVLADFPLYKEKFLSIAAERLKDTKAKSRFLPTGFSLTKDKDDGDGDGNGESTWSPPGNK